MGPDPSLASLAALTSGVGLAMIWVAARVGLLEARRGRRACPSCGHLVRPGNRCRCCG